MFDPAKGWGTVLAHYAQVFPAVEGGPGQMSRPGYTCMSVIREKAIVLKSERDHVTVKFKRDALIERIPRTWAELMSKSEQQLRTPGHLKKPTGKVRDTALRGKAR